MLTAIYKRHLKPGLGVLGDLSISGAVQRVDGFSDKLAMLSENGAKLVLTPMENLPEIQDVPPTILSATDINFFANSQMIVQKAILNE
jgi:ATP-dependent Lon protease